jgi:hypothetical protein
MKAAGQRLSTAAFAPIGAGDGFDAFVAFNSKLVSPCMALAGRIAMSELKQQTIALWILFMLLLMVPWVLE